jgi:hypothetical protein
MPCRVCERSAIISPCKHPDGIITITEFMDIAIMDTIPSISLSRYVKIFKNLHDNCPCKECLINSICANKVNYNANELCDIYKNLVDE